MPAEYKSVLTALGKTGDFKDGVLKVNIPRNDLHVTIAGRAAPTPFGFGGWLALATAVLALLSVLWRFRNAREQIGGTTLSAQ